MNRVLLAHSDRAGWAESGDRQCCFVVMTAGPLFIFQKGVDGWPEHINSFIESAAGVAVN